MKGSAHGNPHFPAYHHCLSLKREGQKEMYHIRPLKCTAEQFLIRYSKTKPLLGRHFCGYRILSCPGSVFRFGQSSAGQHMDIMPFFQQHLIKPMGCHCGSIVQASIFIRNQHYFHKNCLPFLYL